MFYQHSFHCFTIHTIIQTADKMWNQSYLLQRIVNTENIENTEYKPPFRNSGMAEWWNGGMAVWRKGGMAAFECSNTQIACSFICCTTFNWYWKPLRKAALYWLIEIQNGIFFYVFSVQYSVNEVYFSFLWLFNHEI